jgi:hypothetical protein
MRKLTSIAAAIALGAAVYACMHVGSDGKPVALRREEVAIIYEPTQGVEHLIRTATFNTNAANFGFIVPTPSKPELGEAEPALFDELRKFAPADPDLKRGQLLGGGFGQGGGGAVEVVEVAMVAGMTATVLRSNDAAVLEKWLKDNGYTAPADLQSWVAPYLKGTWHLTAFKFEKKPESAGGVTKAVRLSFPVTRPFYPYREPGSAPGGHERLRIYYVSSMLSTALDTQGRAWKAKRTTVGRLRPQTADMISRLARLSSADMPRSPMLTIFTDDSRNRKGASDLEFHVATGVSSKK